MSARIKTVSTHQHALSPRQEVGRVLHEARIVRVDEVRPWVGQPRKWFDPAGITARAESFKAVGQQEALKVIEISGDPKHKYEITDGESRWRSAKEAGLEYVGVLVRMVPFESEVQRHLASLVSNENRSGFTPMERSNAYLLQVTKGGMTQSALAASVGKTAAHVCDYLSLQKLVPEIQQRLEPATPKKDRISVSTGILLAQIPKERQLTILNMSGSSTGRVKTWRVAQTVKKILGTRPRKRSPSERRERFERTTEELRSGIQTLESLGLENSDALGGLGVQTIDNAVEVLKLLRQKAAPRLPNITCSVKRPVIKDTEKMSREEREVYEEEWRLYWVSALNVLPGASSNELLLKMLFPQRPFPKPIRFWTK